MTHVIAFMHFAAIKLMRQIMFKKAREGYAMKDMTITMISRTIRTVK